MKLLLQRSYQKKSIQYKLHIHDRVKYTWHSKLENIQKNIAMQYQSKSRITCLEGLRGIATLMVIFTHIQHFFFPEALLQLKALFSVLPMPLSFLAETFSKAFFQGGFAVTTFWVLSGFVLSYRYFLLLPTNFSNAQQYLVVAAIKRYFRLAVPVLLTVMLSLLLIRENLMFNKSLAQHYLAVHSTWHEYAQWIGDFYSFEANFFNALKSALWDTFVDYERSSSYNVVLWTMEKEFFGSMFLFAFLFLSGWLSNNKWFWVFTILLLTWLRLHWISAFLIGSLLSYSYCLFRARASAVIFSRLEPVLILLKNPFICISCLLILWVLVGLPNYLGVTHLLIAIPLVALSLFSPPLTQWLSARPLLFLGKISFGLYLGHFLIITSLSCYLYLVMIKHWPSLVVATVVAVFTLIISLPLGWLIYRLGDITGKLLAGFISQRIYRNIDRTT